MCPKLRKSEKRQMTKLMAAQSWRPNWQDKEKYPIVKDTSDGQWAWEFLRRNSEYANSCLDIGGLAPEAMQLLCEYWGVTYMFQPSMDFNDMLGYPLFSNVIQVRQITSRHLQIGPAWLDSIAPNLPTHVTMRFDLSDSLPAQLKQAQAQLEAQNERLIMCGIVPAELDKNGKSKPTKVVRRSNKNRFPDYLRYLDAISAGVSAWNIAKHVQRQSYSIEQEHDRVKKDLKAATSLVESGYRRLAMFSNTKR